MSVIHTPEHLLRHGWAVLTLDSSMNALCQHARNYVVPLLNTSNESLVSLRREWTNKHAPVTDDLYGFYAPPKQSDIAGERTNFMYRRGPWSSDSHVANEILSTHDQLMTHMGDLGKTMLNGLMEHTLADLSQTGVYPSGSFPFSRTSVTSQLYRTSSESPTTPSASLLVKDHIDCTLLTLIAIPTDDRQLRVRDIVTNDYICPTEAVSTSSPSTFCVVVMIGYLVDAILSHGLGFLATHHHVVAGPGDTHSQRLSFVLRMLPADDAPVSVTTNAAINMGFLEYTPSTNTSVRRVYPSGDIVNQFRRTHESVTLQYKESRNSKRRRTRRASRHSNLLPCM